MADLIDPVDLMPVSHWAGLLRWSLRTWFAVVLVFLYLPIFFMILFSFNASPIPNLPITGLTFNWYAVMMSDGILLGALGNSIIVAAVVAVLATVIGTAAAFPLVRGGIRFSNAARVFFMAPIMLPGVLIGLGLLIFFSSVLQLPLSLGTVVAGHLVFTVPFVVVIVSARLQGFNRSLEDAAADLGASPLQVLREIVLPLISPAILAGALISVTLSIDEFVITFFTVGSQVTLPIFIYTQIKFGITPEVNAVATVLFVATLCLLLGSSLALSRGHGRRGTVVPQGR
jgi:ABC-type spermidine/putrescine transport system permease subunit II